jgi:hypothetical protein
MALLPVPEKKGYDDTASLVFRRTGLGWALRLLLRQAAILIICAMNLEGECL